MYPEFIRLVRSRWGIVSLACAPLLGGCFGVPRVDEFNNLQNMRKATANARDSYALQPGDIVRLTVYRGGSIPADYRQEITVQPDGQISLVNVEAPVKAKGLTLEELQSRVQEIYAPFFKKAAGGDAELAEVRCSVQFVSSQLSEWLPDQVYVGGQVRRPLPVPYREGLTLMQAVTMAGGWIFTGDPDQTVVIRRTADGQTVTREFDLLAVVRHRGDDPQLFPGDVVYVPLSAIAHVNLFIEFYIRNMIPINPGSIVRIAAGGG